MFRGFRWQLLVFILTFIALLISLAFRISRQISVPEPNAPTPTVIAPVSTATAEPVALPVATVNVDGHDARASFTGYSEGLIGTVKRLNPLFTHLNAVDRDIASLVFEGLFATNEYGAPIPQLAERLVMSSDGLEYVVELRADVLWQNGIPFSADDVVFTMALLSDPQYARYASSAEFWRTIETQKLSERLVRFRLAQPLASFASMLTIGILPEHALRGTTVAQLASHPFNLSPIGTGPYQVAAVRADDAGSVQTMLLQHSPIFQEWLESPAEYQIRELRFDLFPGPAEALDAYRTGQIDALSYVGNRAQLLMLPDARIYTQLESELTALIFNWNLGQFQDRRVRQALALALDIPTIVERHLANAATFADSPIVPGLAAYQPIPFWSVYDIDRAATLFSTAFKPTEDDSDDSDVETTDAAESAFQLRLLVEDSLPLPELAEDIANSWHALGLEVLVHAVSQGEYWERLRSGEFEAAVVAQRIGGDPDLYRFWHPAQEETGQNFGGVDSDVISELLEAIRQERNGIVRQSLLMNLQSQFAEQAIAVPLFYPLYTMAVRDRFEGIRLGYLGTAADRFRGIAEWRPQSIAG